MLRVSGPTATITDGQAEYEARIDPRLPGRPLAVGDRVQWRVSGDERIVTTILPRRTILERTQGESGPARPIVANADVIVIVESLHQPEPRPALIDRYLVAGYVGGLDPLIVLTKLDLADPQVAREVRDLYSGLGFAVLAGDATRPDLAEQIRMHLAGRTGALVGQSGVGKSTLTGALTGTERTVGAVSSHVGGRHTTTDPRQIPMIGGGWIVDTAGVRSLYLPPLDAWDVAQAYPEIRQREGECRFRDCRHLGDAGCAVGAEWAPTRRESYASLVENP